jgi:hypothetical protein
MGVIIEPEALRAEFAIGVGSNWQNTRGLSPEETESLLNEFYLELRKIFPSYHAAPQHLWPAFEEFALLYADRYADRAFPFRTSLPKSHHRGSYRLRWNPAATIFPYNEYLVKVMVRNDEVMIDLNTFRMITSRRFRTVKEMLDDFSPAVPNLKEQAARKFVRNTIDSLIQGGLLQLEPLMKSERKPSTSTIIVSKVDCGILTEESRSATLLIRRARPKESPGGRNSSRYLRSKTTRRAPLFHRALTLVATKFACNSVRAGWVKSISRKTPSLNAQ